MNLDGAGDNSGNNAIPPSKLDKFNDGELFDEIYQTEQGFVGVLAEIHVEGKILHLNDVAIYPMSVADARLKVGLKQILEIFRTKLLQAVKTDGLDKLHITAQRYSGANPGHRIDIWRDLLE